MSILKNFKPVHLIFALVLALVASLSIAAPAHAATDRICMTSNSTRFTHEYAGDVNFGRDYVYPGQCSSLPGQLAWFYSSTGDCYSDWGYRYAKNVKYNWNGDGQLWLRCYLT